MMNRSSKLLLLISFLSCQVLAFIVQGATHYYDFVLTESNFTRLCNTTSILTVNESLPGPVIRINKGDTVYVNAYNQGSYGVTLHWHGVKQPSNPWFDGPEYITQCPIEAGKNFTYEVVFSDEEGTLWWHAHSDWTRATVHGAIVILPVNGTTYPFPQPDQEEVIVLGAWYAQDLRQMVWNSMYTGEDTPRSDAYTINGQPGDLCACSNESTYRLTVDYGKTWLLRLINAANNAEFFFAIAGHNMTVVGMDASYTKPFVTSYLMISPGQTADVLVTFNATPGKYYMAARQFSSTHADVVYFDHTNTTGIIQYNGNYTPPASPLFPTNLPPYKDALAAMNYTNKLRSLDTKEHSIDVPKNLTKRFFFVVSMGMVYCPDSTCGGIYGNKMASSINNISFVNPTTDVLTAYYRNLSGVYDADFPDVPAVSYNYTTDNISLILAYPQKATKLTTLEYGDTVEIIFQGTNIIDAAESHPMHLHGHSFYVVGMGIGNFDHVNDTKSFNLDDPPRLNTVGVPKFGWAAIRFAAKNPGVWYMHCHLDRHMSWGMATAFIVKGGGTSSTSMKRPPNYMPTCNITINNTHVLKKPTVTSANLKEE
ncbi:putative laccase-9 [Drosera capensis]